MQRLIKGGCGNSCENSFVENIRKICKIFMAVTNIPVNLYFFSSCTVVILNHLAICFLKNKVLYYLRRVLNHVFESLKI